MASIVESCNIALSNIRARSINSLDESSIEAQQCKLHVDTVRDIVLRDTDWPMARKTLALALRTDKPLQWVYAYQYPSDCVALRMVTADFAGKGQSIDGTATRFRNSGAFSSEPDPSVPFAIESIGGALVITTDQPEAYGVYTRRVSDWNQFDPLWRTAFEWLLSSRLAIPVIGGDLGRKMREDAIAMYQVSLSSAIAAAQNEQRRPPRRAPSMIEARR